MVLYLIPQLFVISHVIVSSGLRLPGAHPSLTPCTTTELSILLISRITAIKIHVIKYCKQFMKEMVKNCFGLLKIQVKFLIN